MEKIQEQNYQLMLDSTISALQHAYSDYKKAVIKNLEFTWFDSEGVFTVPEGIERRNEDIAEKAKEVTRLCFKIEELKQLVQLRKGQK